MTSFAGKTIVVTGATSGIGLATATELVRQGASVIGIGRSEPKCRAAEQRLQGLGGGGRVAYLVADLRLQAEVRRVAEDVRKLLAARAQVTLDGLVNNAGTFTYWLALTAEGFETQWALNHLTPFLLTRELLPLLQAAPAARIVTVSSDSHYHTELNWADIQLRRRYNGLQAYKQTKLANVLFTAELNRRLGPYSSVRAFAADPGLVDTEIGLKGTPAIARFVWQRRRSAGIPATQAAAGIVYLLGDPAPVKSGDIYWRHEQPRKASPQAQDKPSAARLWSLSARMCGIPA